MKWVAIAGSWKESVPEIERDVRSAVREIVNQGNGIVTGGALGVDYLATEEYLSLDPEASKIKIFLPVSLEIYKGHYFKRAREGVITMDQAEKLIAQLESIKKTNPQAIIEDLKTKIVDKVSYFNRITSIISSADELVAFQINNSEGTQDTINKAETKGISVKLFSYST